MKIDDHLNSTLATIGLVVGTILLLGSIAYSSITGKPFDAAACTLAGGALQAVAGIARGRMTQPPKGSAEPSETESPKVS